MMGEPIEKVPFYRMMGESHRKSAFLPRGGRVPSKKCFSTPWWENSIEKVFFYHVGESHQKSAFLPRVTTDG